VSDSRRWWAAGRDGAPFPGTEPAPQRASGGVLMLYQPGDYVCPADLPRPIICRVEDVESLRVGREVSQVLKLEPLEGPWPAGTLLIRLDATVVPVPARTLWRGGGLLLLPPVRRPRCPPRLPTPRRSAPRTGGVAWVAPASQTRGSA